MSLNTVVNNLIRAAAAIPTHISDVDLDRHVAKLLADEAKVKEQSWKELGLGAYLSRNSPDPNAPKANKRFLASVIKQVDGHNAAIIRAQNQSAREAREERRGETSRSGASRLFGGAMKGLQSNGPLRSHGREGRGSREGGRGERRGGWDDDGRGEHRRDERGRSYRDEGERWSRRDDYALEEESRRDHRSSRSHRDYEEERLARRHRSERPRREEDGGGSKAHRLSREVDEDERHHRRRNKDRDDESSQRRRYRDDSAEKSRSSRNRSRSKDRRNGGDNAIESDGRKDSSRRKDRHHDSPDQEGDHTSHKSNGKHHDQHKNADELYAKPKTRTPTPSPPPPPPPKESPPPSPGPLPPPPKISRMDRYFNEDYDPRLDLGEVPKQGPVVEVGWDNMLAILKERGQKRRVKSPGLFDEDPPTRARIRDDHAQLEIDLRWEKAEKEAKKRKKEERRKKRGDGSDGESEGERKRRKEAEEKVVLKGEEGLFDMAYVKKGGTREWDKGK